MSRTRVQRISPARLCVAGMSKVLLLLCLAGGVTWAASPIDKAVHVEIPRGTPLDAALVRLAQEITDQTGLHVMVASKSVGHQPTAGLRGTFPAGVALTKLLQGSGLAYQAMDDTIAIRPASAPGVADSDSFRSADGTQPNAQEAGSGTKSGEEIGGTDEADRQALALQEVVVTAQKYRQRAFDVPITMTVLGGPKLQTLMITDLERLQFFVPGMLVENDGNSMRVTIRGISNVFGQAALVGTYLDEADVTSEGSFGLDLNPYDLARVEVLKGPQGTLYGEGSMGGTIRYITNKPVLNRFQMLAYVAALFDQYGAPGDQIEMAVNAPLVDGVLGLRIAADLNQEGGWVDQPAANLKNINGKNRAEVRIEVRWQPREDLTVDAMEVIHRSTSGPPIGEDPLGVYTQVYYLTTTPQIEDNYNISNLTLTWDPGLISVVNSATYFTHLNNDRNFGASYQFTPPPSPRFEAYAVSSPITDEDLSDELRVSNSGTGPWRWTVGGFYKRVDNDEPPLLNYFGLPGPPGAPLPAPIPYFSFVHSKSTSVFGDTSYRFFGRLDLGAGIRSFREDDNALIEGDPAEEKATFTSVDPRFYARYGVSKDVNVYASAAKGFRSGGFNGYGYPQYQPEHVWTYDLGTKMSLLAERLSLDTDVFVSNYGAYQIVGLLPPPAPQFTLTSNAGDARIKGIEADITWRPARGWELSANGDYIDARFIKIAALYTSYEVGDPLDLVPRYQVTTSAQRDFRWQGRSGFARIDYVQRSRETFRNRGIGPWYYSQSDYMYLLDLHTGIHWNDSLELGFFVQNLLNDRGYIGSDSIETYAAREQPRTFGVDFRIALESQNESGE